jgi:hypothetical protein
MEFYNQFRLMCASSDQDPQKAESPQSELHIGVNHFFNGR